jgi:hypothetical protein
MQDPEGDFSILPSAEEPWDHRESFNPTAETELEPVPGSLQRNARLPF